MGGTGNPSGSSGATASCAPCGDAFIAAVSKKAQAVGCTGIPSTVGIENGCLTLKLGWRYGIDPPLQCR